MRTKTVLASELFVLLALPWLGATAAAQGLPPGDGIEIIAVSCTQCHSLDRLAKVRLTAAEWENALYDMMARGAIVEGDDLAIVREYLANNLATDRKEAE